MWVKGDLHVHSHCCGDGTLPVEEIVERAREFCDYIAISGHCRSTEFWRIEKQHAEIVEARKKFDMPIFCTAETEFPIPRHVMLITTPDDRELELQRAVCDKFCRFKGVEGIDAAMEELRFIEENWKDNCFMIFNHPNSPDVPGDVLKRLATSPVFKALACVDRGERRAPQTWDIGAEWDQLLSMGFRISTRCGSDFHGHFTNGGHAYLPGEFVQDCLWVEKNDYKSIFNAYKNGNFYTMCGNLIDDPTFAVTGEAGARKVHLAFDLKGEMEKVEVVSEGKVVAEFTDFTDRFDQTFSVPDGKYYRVRGTGKMQKRWYTEGEFEPIFQLNPIYFQV